MKKEDKKKLKLYTKNRQEYRIKLKNKVLSDENLPSVIVNIYEQFIKYARNGKINKDISDYNSLVPAVLSALARDTVDLNEVEVKKVEEKTFEVLSNIHKDFTNDFKITEYWNSLKNKEVVLQ